MSENQPLRNEEDSQMPSNDQQFPRSGAEARQLGKVPQYAAWIVARLDLEGDAAQAQYDAIVARWS